VNEIFLTHITRSELTWVPVTPEELIHWSSYNMGIIYFINLIVKLLQETLTRPNLIEKIFLWFHEYLDFSLCST